MFRLRNSYRFLIPFFIVVLFVGPSFLLFFSFFQSGNENWEYIVGSFLKEGITQTIFLFLSTIFICFLISYPLAILICIYDFPLRKWFQYLLMLPFTIPTYIGTYAYYKFFDFSSPINLFLRQKLRINHFLNFDLFSFSGAVFIFSIFLYPYMYISLYVFFKKNIGEIIDSARSLKANLKSIFFKILFPLSLPVIIGGLSLIAMEVISDFGVTSFLGIRTFSAEIFKIWFNMNDLRSALKLSSYLVPIIIFILYISHRYGKLKSMQFFSMYSVNLRKLRGFYGFCATCLCTVVFLLGYVIPVLVMLRYSFIVKGIQDDFLSLLMIVFNSLFIVILTSLVIMIISIYIAYTARKRFIPYAEIFSFQYSLPGMVIAVLVILFLSQGEKLNILPSGSIVFLRETSLLLIFAYIIRFFILGYNCAYNNFLKIGISYTEISKTLGCGEFKSFLKIELPLMFSSLCFGTFLVVTDLMKELPLTLFLRPFNFDTLSTKTYDLVNDEMFAEGTPSALMLIFLMGIFTFFSLFLTVFKKSDYQKNR